MKEKTNYDHSYKLLFSEPAMVRDLLTGFFDDGWMQDLNFSTLQRLNKEYITENLRERESDVVWKIQWKGQWLYLLILIEFQSTNDQFMIVRMLSYIALMYQDIIKEDPQVRHARQLPPVLPLILYMGELAWKSSLSFSDLIPDNLPEILKKFQPQLTCWLLDEGRYIINGVPDEDNLVVSLISFEQSKGSREILEKVRRLISRLKGPEFDSLRRAYTVYLSRTLKAKEIMPNIELNELHEVEHMLSQRVEIWKQEAISEGLRQGREEGLQQGREEGMQQGMQQGAIQGELAVIKRQLIKRFGPLTAVQENILKNKSANELLDISDRILDATTMNDIL